MQRTRQFNGRVIGLAMLLVLSIGAFAFLQNESSANRHDVNGAEHVVVTFSDFEFHRQLYEPLIVEFQDKYPTIQVQYVAFDKVTMGSDFDKRQLASLADTIALPALPGNAETDYFLDLGPFIEADANFKVEAFWPDLLDGCRVDGRIVGLPVSVQASLIFFDKAAFDAAGLPHPALGWTWDDFQEAARMLTQRSGNQVSRYGFVDGGRPLSLLGPLVDTVAARNDVAQDASALAQTLSWYVDLAREGVIPIFSEGEDAAETSEAFIHTGKAAMWIGRLSDLPELRASLQSELGIAPFPVSPDAAGSNTTRAIASCAFISAGTSHPREAWTWLNFLTTHSLRRQPGDVPSRIAVAEDSSYWADIDDESETTLRFALTHAWYGNISSDPLQSIGKALTQAVEGKVDLLSALGSTKTAPSTPSSTSESTPIFVATPRPTEMPVTASGAVVTVDYFVDTFFHTSFEVIEPLAEAFNETHPGIVVRLSDSRTTFGNTGYGAIEIAQQFDCFAHSAGAGIILRDQLYSLNPLIETDTEGTSLIDDFYPSLLSLDRLEGELYGWPAASQPTVIYYNVDYLAETGLKPPALDWTVDDFWAFAASATSQRVYGFVPYQWGVAGIDFLFSAEDVQLYNLSVESPEVNFDDPAVISVVSKMVDAADSRIMTPVDDGGLRSLIGNHRQRESLVMSGRAATWANTAGLRYGFFSGPDGPGFKVGVVPVPLGRGPLAPPTPAVALYISRRAKHPNACWEWMKFLSARPGAFLGIPARRLVLESADFEAAVGAEAAAAYRAVMSQPRREFLTGEPSPYDPYPLIFWWQDALAAAFAGADPAKALTDLQRKGDVYLSCLITAPKGGTDQWLACAQQADPSFKIRDPGGD